MKSLEVISRGREGAPDYVEVAPKTKRQAPVKRIREMSQAELGAFIQSHLHEKGIDVVLSGGAVVAI